MTNSEFNQILNQTFFTHEDIVVMLKSNDSQTKMLFEKATQVKNSYAKNVVYFRGLIEFSNICCKNCLYCGIRAANNKVGRYKLTLSEVEQVIEQALNLRLASVVLQSGECCNDACVDFIDEVIRKIKKQSDNKLGITLSVGEHSEDVYRRWFDSGAHRFLLRIETSNPILYKKIHPDNNLHRFDNRLDALRTLQRIGYQTGTGVMIGLPFQTIDDLAADLLFFRDFGIDMVGMGPYIEHTDTPLYSHAAQLVSLPDRLQLSLKMIAVLRIMMPLINIAATTALQAISPTGREKAIQIGANVLMPNITPNLYKNSYFLYENKPFDTEDNQKHIESLVASIRRAGSDVGFDQWGDSEYFYLRKSK